MLDAAERRARATDRMRRWRQTNPDKARAAKARYYTSEKGRLQKRKEDAAYRASGGRAETEARRAARPVSQARLAARRRWAERNQAYFTAMRSLRRSLDRALPPEEFWILQEAVALARLREQRVGGQWHVDHIVPVSKGGTSRPENLQVVPACWNRRKSNVHAERFFGA